MRPALPWLHDDHLLETLATLTRVYASLPSDARIVPGHGVPMGREDLIWHLDWLNAVRQGVQAAVAEGLALEQTIERVAVPDYRGYALFDWVHPDLNLPAAYQDLGGAKK